MTLDLSLRSDLGNICVFVAIIILYSTFKLFMYRHVMKSLIHLSDWHLNQLSGRLARRGGGVGERRPAVIAPFLLGDMG